MYRKLFIFLALCFFVLSCEEESTEPPRENTGNVSGVISNALTSEPIEQAEVAIIGESARSTSTNASGYYIFENLPIREEDLTQIYNLQITKAGYRSKTEAVELRAERNVTKNFILNPIPPVIHVSTSALDFGTNSSSESIIISNSSQYGSFHWEATDNADWLTLSPNNGGPIAQNSQAISCTVDRVDQDPGNYNAAITITTLNKPAGDATISVTMTVRNINEPQLSFPETVNFGTELDTVQTRFTNSGTGQLT